MASQKPPPPPAQSTSRRLRRCLARSGHSVASPSNNAGHIFAVGARCHKEEPGHQNARHLRPIRISFLVSSVRAGIHPLPRRFLCALKSRRFPQRRPATQHPRAISSLPQKRTLLVPTREYGQTLRDTHQCPPGQILIVLACTFSPALISNRHSSRRIKDHRRAPPTTLRDSHKQVVFH